MVLPAFVKSTTSKPISVDAMQRTLTPGDRRLRAVPKFDRNGRIVVAARGLRSYAFGLNAVSLGLYLAALDIPGENLGVVFSAAFVGSLGLTVVIAAWGDRIGRRRLLMAGSGL